MPLWNCIKMFYTSCIKFYTLNAMCDALYTTDLLDKQDVQGENASEKKAEQGR